DHFVGIEINNSMRDELVFGEGWRVVSVVRVSSHHRRDVAGYTIPKNVVSAPVRTKTVKTAEHTLGRINRIALWVIRVHLRVKSVADAGCAAAGGKEVVCVRAGFAAGVQLIKSERAARDGLVEGHSPNDDT